MSNSSDESVKKEKIFSLIMFIFAFLLFIGWPITHIFFANKYMQFVGFASGSFTLSQTYVSGVCGLFPVLILAYLGFSPKQKWGLVIINSLTLVLLAVMFVYLIITSAFPGGLLPNVVIQLLLAVIVPILYSILVLKPITKE